MNLIQFSFNPFDYCYTYHDVSYVLCDDDAFYVLCRDACRDVFCALCGAYACDAEYSL